MSNSERRIRVLYSFPHKLGADRICYAAWQHVQNAADSGADMVVFPGVLQRPLTGRIQVQPTLARGRLRIPYRLLGTIRACRLHDHIVSRRLPKIADRIDLVHTFPLGSLQTLRTAKALGIPTVLERCNAHTRYAYDIVQRECELLGVTMPPGHEHAYNEAYLRREEREYEAADYLLCPSEFVERTFIERGFQREKLVRFQYGYDPAKCYPASPRPEQAKGLTALFAAGCAPRKGLHHALRAWLKSSASKEGTLLIAGEFIPGYAKALGSMLSHPSVKRIGFRRDLPEVMRNSDVLILPSIEEGSALVTYDARGSGCVLLVSDASGAVCTHMHDALVHKAGDPTTLADHLTLLDRDRKLLERLRAASLATAPELTWRAAGARLYQAYRGIVAKGRSGNVT